MLGRNFIFLHPSPHIVQCVGKRRVMSVKKFSASFVSRQSAAGILAKNEVFATATSTCGISFVTFLLKEKLTLIFYFASKVIALSFSLIHLKVIQTALVGIIFLTFAGHSMMTTAFFWPAKSAKPSSSKSFEVMR